MGAGGLAHGPARHSLSLHRHRRPDHRRYPFRRIRMAWNWPSSARFRHSACATSSIGKTVATSITIGSGMSGGMFAPALFVGGMSGGLVGKLGHKFFPDIVTQPGAYILVGMAAFFAGGRQCAHRSADHGDRTDPGLRSAGSAHACFGPVHRARTQLFALRAPGGKQIRFPGPMPRMPPSTFWNRCTSRTSTIRATSSCLRKEPRSRP